MKWLHFVWIVCAFSALPALGDNQTDLQGAWRTVAGIDHGQPESADRNRALNVRMVFRGREFLLESDGDSPVSFDFELLPTTGLKRLDLKSERATIKAIYEFRDQELRICWSKDPLSPTAPADFNSGFCYVLRRERPAQDLPQLDGTWKVTLLRDPSESGVLLGDRLAKRQMRFAFAGDVLLWQEAGQKDRVVRYRIDPTEADDVPLRRMTILAKNSFDVAYEYDKDSLKLYFSADPDDNNAPKDVPSSGMRIMMIRDYTPAPKKLDGTWAAVSILQNGSRLSSERSQEFTRLFKFSVDECIRVDADRNETTYELTRDDRTTPKTMDFRGPQSIAAIYERYGELIKLVEPAPGDDSNSRPAGFSGTGVTYILYRVPSDG